MKYIFILAAVLFIALYYIIAEVIWNLRNRIFRRKFITGVLIAALLLSQTSIVDLFTKTDAESASAAEAENAEIITISDFTELPDDIREQVVPVGTALEELVLPDTLEAVCDNADTVPDTGTSDSQVGGGNVGKDKDDTEEIAPGEDAGQEEGKIPKSPETGSDNDAKDNGEDTETPKAETPDIETPDTETNEQDETVTEEEDTVETDTDTSAEPAADTVMQADTGSFVMPEYQTENVIEVKTLEADSESEDNNTGKEEATDISGERVTIENITWQSEPEYDGDTEGEYIFTAILPDGYVLTDTVNTPQITVTVGETDNIALLSGDGVMPIAASHSHSGWTATSSLPSSSGSYYMTASVSGSWTVPSGTTNLCLNGKTINGMITVPSGATLYIYDEGGGKVSNSGNIMQVNSGGKAYINGGTYENTSGSSYGIIVNGYLQIDDGTIKGAPKSATIAVRGDVVINQADVSGPSNAVSAENSGKAYIYGGTFSSSSATTMAAAKDAYMCINMTNGGTITNSVSGKYAITVTGTADIVYANTSGSSTSVNVNSGAVAEINAGSFNSTSSDTVTNSGTLTITGGTFKASSSYNVVNISSGTTTITGGTFTGGQYAVNNSGTLKLSGKPSFSGSTADIYLASGKYITVAGTLSNTTPYSVATYTNPTASTPVVITDSSTKSYNNAAKFTAANSDYKVNKNSSNQLELAVSPAHTHDSITFTPWTSTTSLPSSSGSYYLTGNVSLSGTWTAPSGTTNLCLNGYDITFSSGNISVGSGSTLNIYDCQDKGTITGVSYGVHITDGSLTVNGGTITTSGDSGVYIDGNGSLTVHGGTITSTSAARHGLLTGTSSNASITMDGGTVTTEKAAMTAIYLEGKDTVSISGGTICNDNTTSASGAFYIGNSSQVTITDGTIRGTLYGVRNLGTTSITGATVIGGVDGLRNSGTITIKGGSFSGGTTYGINNTGSMKLLGSPTITGGTADIYLGSSKYITVTGTLSNTTPYSVATYTNPTASTPIVITNSSTTPYNNAAKFSAAKSSYIVRKNSSDQLELAVPVTYYTITYAPGTGAGITGTIPSGTKTGGEAFTLSTQTFTRTGYTQDGWAVTDGGEKVYGLGGTYTDDRNITLYPHWTANTWTVTYEYEGATGGNSTASKQVTYDSTYGNLPTPTRAGYTFKGWYTEANGSGNEVESATKVTTDSSHKLYAYWEDDIAPIIGELTYNYTPKTVNGWVIGKDKLIITVPVTEEGSGVSEITYTKTPEGGTLETKTAPLMGTEDAAVKKATITVNADFKGTIKIDCQDAAGNPAASVTVGANLSGAAGSAGIIIEDNVPTVSFVINGHAVSGETDYYDESQAVTVNVIDDMNNTISGGIASVTYQIGNGSEQSVTGDFTTTIKAQHSFTISADKIPAGVNDITVKVEDNAGNTAEAVLTVKVKGPEKTPDAKINYISETLTGLVSGAEYTVNGVTKKADAAGTIPIEESWIGTPISIIKKGNGDTTSDSTAQSLTIPARPAAPSAPTLSERTDTSITLKTIANAEYRIYGGSWQGSPAFDGLKQKTKYSCEAYLPATQSSFCSLVSGATVIVTRPTPPTADKLAIDYIAETFSLAQGVEAFSDAGTASRVEAGDVTGCMGRDVYIRYAESGDIPESLTTKVSIPDRPAAPTGFTVSNATYPGAKDGKITGLDTGYIYEISDDNGSTWQTVQRNGAAVTGLVKGNYQIRVKAVNHKNFHGVAAPFTINETAATAESTPDARVDHENGKLTGLTPGAEYDITYEDAGGTPHTERVKADQNGNIHIEDDWTGKNVTVVKKGNGTTTKDSAGQSVSIPDKEERPKPGTVDVSAPGAKDGKITNLNPDKTYEISRDGGKTWTEAEVNEKGEITDLPEGSYKVRTKAKDGTLCSDAVDCKIGSPVPPNSDNSSSSGGDDSGGQQGDDGGSQTDTTPSDTVMPPTDTQTPKTGTPSTDETGDEESEDAPDDVKTGTGRQGRTGNTAGTGDTDGTDDAGKTENVSTAATRQNTEPEQDTQPPAQSVQAQIRDGAITVTGDVIMTGTIGTAESTTMTLIVGEGAVIVTVVSDGYQSNAGVADTVAVANAVLTSEQIQRVNSGETIEIRVDVKDISAEVPKEDKDVIEQGLQADAAAGTGSGTSGDESGELILGAYIDISMYIKVGDGDWDAVAVADVPIEIVVGIPDELQSDGRTYYIARCHEGEYALLDDLDSEPDTITIKTELFSTYAIAYRQGSGTDADGVNGFLASLSWGAVALWSMGILVMLGIVIFLIFWKRRKEEAS